MINFDDDCDKYDIVVDDNDIVDDADDGHNNDDMFSKKVFFVGL